MPSQNREDAAQQMVAESGTSEYEPDYKKGVPEALTDDFFTLDTTVGYFPTLRFTDMHVPVGSAKPYCVHLDWIRKDQRSQTGRYHAVDNLGKCASAYNVKFRWQEGDPKDGVDFALWKQYSH